MSCRESKDIFILLRPSGSTKTQVPLKHLTMCCSRFQGRGYGAAAARLTRDQKVGSSNHIDASHSGQPLVNGERLVRYQVDALITSHDGIQCPFKKRNHSCT
jgi:hypothetical protein